MANIQFTYSITSTTNVWKVSSTTYTRPPEPPKVPFNGGKAYIAEGWDICLIVYGVGKDHYLHLNNDGTTEFSMGLKVLA